MGLRASGFLTPKRARFSLELFTRWATSRCLRCAEGVGERGLCGVQRLPRVLAERAESAIDVRSAVHGVPESARGWQSVPLILHSGGEIREAGGERARLEGGCGVDDVGEYALEVRNGGMQVLVSAGITVDVDGEGVCGVEGGHGDPVSACSHGVDMGVLYMCEAGAAGEVGAAGEAGEVGTGGRGGNGGDGGRLRVRVYSKQVVV